MKKGLWRENGNQKLLMGESYQSTDILHSSASENNTNETVNKNKGMPSVQLQASPCQVEVSNTLWKAWGSAMY
jgi:hypothetical protein